MKVILPIIGRSRKYGYLFWSIKDDLIMKELFGAKDEVYIFFNGKDLGVKRIDWKNRRIFISYVITRSINVDKNQYILEMNNGKLEITV